MKRLLQLPLLPITRLLARLALPALALLTSRRRALRGFRSGLAESGLPDDVAAELTEAFPSVDLKQITGKGTSE